MKEIFKTIKALKSSFGVFAAQSVLINLRQEIYEIHVPDEINNKKNMTFLIVQNGYSSELASLGKIKSFSELSEKRITKAVRESLRLKYGYLNVKVSCSACFVNGIWRGKCKVNGEELNYKIKQ